MSIGLIGWSNDMDVSWLLLLFLLESKEVGIDYECLVGEVWI